LSHLNTAPIKSSQKHSEKNSKPQKKTLLVKKLRFTTPEIITKEPCKKVDCRSVFLVPRWGGSTISQKKAISGGKFPKPKFSGNLPSNREVTPLFAVFQLTQGT
jgi:hypothetical protein